MALDDFLYDDGSDAAEPLVIDNKQNIEAQNAENLPEVGPYTVRFKDIKLE